jgi:translation initiation factor 3 subunit B
MMASIHRQGVRLWGGTSWEPLQRFAHPFVKLIDFSPCENYLVTWSNDPFVFRDGGESGPQYPSMEDEGNSLAVWDIKTGNLLRSFPVTQTDQTGSDPSGKKQIQWPGLKWSPDDNFVARVLPGQQISVYELPGMGLLEKKSLKIEGVVDFEWCPLGDRDEEVKTMVNGNAAKSATKKSTRENMLAYWVPEIANQPARVTLMAIPSRAILRSKNLFNVTEVCCIIRFQLGSLVSNYPI